MAAAAIPVPQRLAPMAPPLDALFRKPIPMKFSNKIPLPFPPQVNMNQKTVHIPSPFIIKKKPIKNRKIKNRKKIKKPQPAPIVMPPFPNKAPMPAPLPFAMPPLPNVAPLPNKAPLPFGIPPLKAAPLPIPIAPIPAQLPKAPLPNKAPIPAPLPKAPPLMKKALLPKKAPMPAPLPAPFPLGMPPLPNVAPLPPLGGPPPLPAPLPLGIPLPNKAPMPPPPLPFGIPPLPNAAPMPPPFPFGAPPPLGGPPPFPFGAPPPFPFGAPPPLGGPPPLPGLPPIHNKIPPPVPFPFMAPIAKPTVPNTDEKKDDNSFLLFETDNDDEKFIPPISSNYAVNYNHVKTKIIELTESIVTTDEHKGHKLLEIFDKISITSDHLSMWVRWSGGSFPDKNSARTSLKTVIDYAEQKPSSPLIKQQLRVITKLIMDKGIDKSEEYIHFILLLATHGKVCNVMKDIAINNAYGMMTQSLTDIIKLQTLENIILRELRDYRHILVEKLHGMFKFNTNQHTVNGFYNEMAPLVGLNKYIDNHLGKPYGTNSSHYKKGLDKRFFKVLYNKENIVKRIYMLIGEKKIGYQKIVKFLEDNCPKNINKMEFLQMAINIDNGEINENYLCWILRKLNVFGEKAKDWNDIQKCWDDIK